MGSSYEVASRPGGNSRCCPAHRREEKRAAACADLKKNISQGGFDSSNVPAVLSGQKRDFSAYQQWLGNGNGSATSSSTFTAVGFPLPLPISRLLFTGASGLAGLEHLELCFVTSVFLFAFPLPALCQHHPLLSKRW